MSVTVKQWIGTNGDVLLPLTDEAYNEGLVLSGKGVVYIPVVEAINEVGNSVGLLLALTYGNIPEVPEEPVDPVQGNPIGLLLPLTYAA